ncbi:unnamed protein product [Oikopleura dioica]|uniref:VWFA domain-containing protein n=1 Tax=Oikopleura dioica TaxID=34765 RepID=E4XFI0_OIKDI|nr:unnamed protein product [Oikopleura dioica]
MTTVTKAIIEDINMQSCCECINGSKPFHDIIVVIDGSDSFNNKVCIDGKTDGGEAFHATQKMIDQVLLPGLRQNIGDDRATFTIVQFSGIKQLEHCYEPGSGGVTVDDLLHYKIEIEPCSLEAAQRTIFYDGGLDGNGQLFLCLQDLNIKGNFVEGKFEEVKETNLTRKRSMIIISDEEWDINSLKSAFGGKVGDRSHIARVNRENYEVYPIIVRPNEYYDLEDEFIKNELASRPENYKKVFTGRFDTEMKEALKELIADFH